LQQVIFRERLFCQLTADPVLFPGDPGIARMSPPSLVSLLSLFVFGIRICFRIPDVAGRLSARLLWIRILPVSVWQVPFHLVLLSPSVPLPVFLLSGLLFACRRIFIGLSFFSLPPP
jgi:hypothetical protein